jgi:hypothetical protein
MAPEIPKRSFSSRKPDRTSKKISRSVSKKASKKTLLELEVEKDELENRAITMRQALKPQASFSSAYWIENARIALVSKRSVGLQREISKQCHEELGIEGKFWRSEEAIRLREQFRALEADERLFRAQAKRVDTGTTGREIGKATRRSFVELFTTSKLGLGITNTGRGRREASAQRRFRAACIKAYNASNPDPKKQFLWCPIIRDWFPRVSTCAAHLFAYMHGQDLMDTVFGVMEKPELFSPLNGMIVSQLVEGKFDKGFMAIVPRLPDYPTQQQIAQWNLSEPKEYKVRILDLENPEVDEFILPGSERTWRDLDGADVEFRSTFRPRARYFYFHYCMQILRRAWRAEKIAAEHMKKEFGKGYWGTIGPYLPKSMLQALIEELGHGYEGLLKGGEGDKATANQEDRNILLAVASSQVKASREEGEDEGSDDDEDEGGDGDLDDCCE